MCAPCWQIVFEQRQAAQRQPEPPEPPPVATAPPVMVADELAKLVTLRDAGVLTDDEFETRKSLLLGKPAKPLVPPEVEVRRSVDAQPSATPPSIADLPEVSITPFTVIIGVIITMVCVFLLIAVTQS